MLNETTAEDMKMVIDELTTQVFYGYTRSSLWLALAYRERYNVLGLISRPIEASWTSDSCNRMGAIYDILYLYLWKQSK